MSANNSSSANSAQTSNNRGNNQQRQNQNQNRNNNNPRRPPGPQSKQPPPQNNQPKGSNPKNNAPKNPAPKPSLKKNAPQIKKDTKNETPSLPEPIKTTTATATTTTTSTQIEAENEPEPCLICCDKMQIFSLGSCNHRVLCASCCLRRRVLYNEKTCPVCKSDLEQIIFTRDKSREFPSYDLSTLKSDKHFSIFVEDESFLKILNKIHEFWCPTCQPQESFPTLPALKRHLKTAHNQTFCDLCLDERKVFNFEQRVYPKDKLIDHLKKGDPDNETIKPHPRCTFCDTYFYDDEKLYYHLQQKHFTCHVCEKMGTHHQYFRDFRGLNRHHYRDHYPCDEPECQGQLIAVFATPMELKIHDVETHHSNRVYSSRAEERSARRLDIDLRYASPEEEDTLSFNYTPASLGNIHQNQHQHHSNFNSNQAPPVSLNLSSEVDFPSLSSTASGPSSTSNTTSTSSTTSRVPSSTSRVPTSSLAPLNSSWVSSSLRNTSPAQLGVEHFPALPSRGPSGPASSNRNAATSGPSYSNVANQNQKKKKAIVLRLG